VVDRQTGERYPIGGALPAEAVNELLDNNFDGLPETAFENINLKAVTAVSADDYYRGPGDARYVFIEYSDFNCGYCARFHSTMKNLLDTRSDVGWVYRQFAILNNSESVANVAECVGEGGENEDAFWQFADAYFNQS
jgi:protein-disulfide isomerase